MPRVSRFNPLADKWKLRPNKPLYIACDELDFSWFPEEVGRIKNLWKENFCIADIAEDLGRKPAEVMILLIDLSLNNWIEQRDGGMF
jgi:predicted Rossmann fold nucleotide-binding protein DprA/Smf involved in DNA uptake